MLVILGCHNKILQTGWFKQQKFIFLQFWLVESPRTSFWWELSFRLVDGCLFVLCSHGLSSVMYAKRGKASSLVSFPLRTLIPSHWGPTLMTLFNLYYFHRGPIFKHNHTETWASVYKFWRNSNIQSIILPKLVAASDVKCVLDPTWG